MTTNTTSDLDTIISSTGASVARAADSPAAAASLAALRAKVHQDNDPETSPAAAAQMERVEARLNFTPPAPEPIEGRGQTRAEQEASLANHGVVGAAADLLLGVLAPARHRHRVRRAKEAALAAAHAAGHVGPGAELAALLVLIADMIGVGGDKGLGLGLASTARHPGLAHLGKGRKQANDGDAWSAAVAAAAEQLAGEFPLAALTPVLLTDGWRLRLFGEGERAKDHDVLVGEQLIPAAWMRSIAGRALIRCMGVEGEPDFPLLAFAYSPEGWAALYNAAAVDEPQSDDPPEALEESAAREAEAELQRGHGLRVEVVSRRTQLPPTLPVEEQGLD